MEQETRQEVVLLLTIIFLLEMLGDKVDEFPEEDKKEINLSSKHVNSIAQILCKPLSKSISAWAIAKMKVRASILKRYTNGAVMHCMNSDLWENDIFPIKMLEDLKARGHGQDLVKS